MMTKITQIKLYCVNHDNSYKYIICKNISSYLNSCLLYMHNFTTPIRTLQMVDNRAKLVLSMPSILDSDSNAIQYFEKCNYVVLTDASETTTQNYYFFVTGYSFMANSQVIELSLEIDAHIHEYYNNKEYRALVSNELELPSDVISPNKTVRKHYNRFTKIGSTVYSRIVPNINVPNVPYSKEQYNTSYYGSILWLAVRINRQNTNYKLATQTDILSGDLSQETVITKAYKECNVNSLNGLTTQNYKLFNTSTQGTFGIMYLPIGYYKDTTSGRSLLKTVESLKYYMKDNYVTYNSGTQTYGITYDPSYTESPIDIASNNQNSNLDGILSRIWQLVSPIATKMWLTYNVPFGYVYDDSTSQVILPSGNYMKACFYSYSDKLVSSPFFIIGADKMISQYTANVECDHSTLTPTEQLDLLDTSSVTAYALDPALNYLNKYIERMGDYENQITYEGNRTSITRNIRFNGTESPSLVVTDNNYFTFTGDNERYVVIQEPPSLYSLDMNSEKFYSQNRYNQSATEINKAIMASSKALLNLATGNAIGAVGGVVGTGLDIIENRISYEARKNTAVNNTNTNGNLYNAIYQPYGDLYYTIKLSPSTDNIYEISSMWNRYGYEKIDIISNIFDRTRKLWDYIQTNECSIPQIHNLTNRRILENAFNAGVFKIWNDVLTNKDFNSYMNKNNCEVSL